MSTNCTAEQYDADFLPQRLNNWEVARAPGSGARRPQARTGRTQPVVDARGHLMPGVKRRHTAFVLSDEVWQHSSARWPQCTRGAPKNAAFAVGGTATMGYKGIATNYLPSSTVRVLTVTAPGSKERLFQ
ncbi:hypothetical protein WJX81_000736 [Elliptochloris bilobata]|uniref:Cilia- and flagella-associated protein 126 n=1 Tax=Elliptochloris bilobata TaxID=381761 RepID=A0AAW1RTB0_9CHLO